MFLYFSIILLILLFIICLNFFFLYKNYRNLKKDISKLYIAFKRMRYGDISVRMQGMNDKYLEKTVNRLFETISDRENMIKEYQTTLSDKNLSLEEIIKQEKQLRLFKEDFAATLAHDMKVPVIAELNSLNYLLEGRFGELNEKQTQVLNLMQSSNQELKDLIENMLETYKLDQKEIKLNIARHSVNEFIKSVVAEMFPIAEKNLNKIILSIEKTEDISLSFDDFQMKRVLKNIIQNAISFSPAKHEIEISSDINEKNILLHVTNTGMGILQEDLNLIFQKYYCGHSKFRKAGTGLGLYLSQQIMLAHNGKIEIDSSIPEKTTFTVVIPNV